MGKITPFGRHRLKLARFLGLEREGCCQPSDNQGQCGSCYTFGSTAVVETAVFLNGFDLPNLSEQQIVSCSQAYGNLGCNGGLQPRVFEYLHYNYQVPLTQYPYISGEGTTYCCNTTEAANGTIYTTAMALVTQNNSEAMKTAISQGVVTITVDASSDAFNYYYGGIFDQAEACGTKLDHAIAAVGYGTDTDGTPYFIVRNSWSAQWGDAGYIKMQNIGDGPGMCGMQMAAYTADATYVPNQSGNEQS